MFRNFFRLLILSFAFVCDLHSNKKKKPNKKNVPIDTVKTNKNGVSLLVQPFSGRYSRFFGIRQLPLLSIRMRHAKYTKMQINGVAV